MTMNVDETQDLTEHVRALPGFTRNIQRRTGTTWQPLKAPFERPGQGLLAFRLQGTQETETGFAKFTFHMTPMLENVTSIQVMHVYLNPNIADSVVPGGVFYIRSPSLASGTHMNSNRMNGASTDIISWHALEHEGMDRRTNILATHPPTLVYSQPATISRVEFIFVDAGLSVLPIGGVNECIDVVLEYTQ
jgi:hypothetical protein